MFGIKKFPYSIERNTPGYVNVNGNVAIGSNKAKERAMLNAVAKQDRTDLAYFRGKKIWRPQ